MILNLGVEQNADLRATFFSGSDFIEQLITEYDVDLKNIADKILTLVKYISCLICFCESQLIVLPQSEKAWRKGWDTKVTISPRATFTIFGISAFSGVNP